MEAQRYPYDFDGVVTGADEVFAVGRDGKCADVVPVSVVDGPLRAAAGLVIPAVDDSKVIGGE